MPLPHKIYPHSFFPAPLPLPQPQQRESRRETTRLLREGKLRVRVSHSFALDDASEAFRALAERRAIGKVVVTCQGEGAGVGAAKL